MESMEVPEPPVIGFKVKPVVNPEGVVVDKATWPVKPFTGDTDIVVVVREPAAIIIADAAEESVKSAGGGGAVTITVAVALCVALVEFPVTVIV